ncbi:23S rRNA (uracil(1939)-C(5))-methyltransferase RlmD [Mycoplasmopsis columboralis]|uniref:Hypothetical RNA methyltransferase n=1 Tax=Mycoplasmopsis columboralis TaxID=171282 RepID=A0A449B6N7_9BACT|nr:23S rRNA (uracil(1939)-C(5))-methyltransferase RlmD [Mycoplasmopsis columboralis]VEU76270.1 Hypothetical RNA methyltransferase [Mycoplasmopsis columboralis]
MCVENKIVSECIELTYEGYGVILYKNKRFFVPNLLPGEKAEIIITKNHKNYGYGKVLKLLTLSKHRNSLFEFSNAASLIHLSYPEQLKWKQQYLENLFSRNLNISLSTINKIKWFDPIYNYRNKVRYPIFVDQQNIYFGEYLWKSYQLRKTKATILIQDTLIEVSDFVLANLNTFFKNELSKVRFIKEVSFRTNKEQEIQITFDLDPSYDLPKKFIQLLCQKSNIIEIYSRKNLQSELIYSRKEFSITLSDKKFKISSDNFFQVNLTVFENILKDIAKYLQNKTNKNTLIDAYCGVGVFSQFFSNFFRKSIGIEVVESSIHLAKINSTINGLKNINYYAGKVEDVVFKKEIDVSDSVLIVDPPRAGLENKVINWINQKQINSIVYLSCDPRTLTRDLKIFLDKEYKIVQITPYEMFPNTHHIETLVFLEK